MLKDRPKQAGARGKRGGGTRGSKNRILEIDAVELRIRAEKKLGEILKEIPKNIGVKGRFKKNPPVKDNTPTLSEQGIDKHLADRASRKRRKGRKTFRRRGTFS